MADIGDEPHLRHNEQEQQGKHRCGQREERPGTQDVHRRRYEDDKRGDIDNKAESQLRAQHLVGAHGHGAYQPQALALERHGGACRQGYARHRGSENGHKAHGELLIAREHSHDLPHILLIDHKEHRAGEDEHSAKAVVYDAGGAGEEAGRLALEQRGAP